MPSKVTRLLGLVLVMILFCARAYCATEEPAVGIAGLSVMFGTIETGSGLAAGAYYRKSIFQGAVAYSVAGYRLAEAQIGLNAPRHQLFLRPMRYEYVDVYDLPAIEDTERGLLMYFEFRYRHLAREDFFGIGPQSILQNETDFAQVEKAGTVVAGYQVSPHVRFAIRTGYTSFDIERGNNKNVTNLPHVFDDQQAPGLNNQPDFFHITPALLLDFRDAPRNPHAGGAIGISFTRFQPNKGRFAFNRLLIDSRYFVRLLSPSHVLALRLNTLLDSKGNSNRVPFYLQETLGGSQTLRGFDDFRFRGEKMVHFSAEYRWEVRDSIELALFYDTGKVFSESSDFDFSSLEKSYGVGIRFKISSGVIFRADFGHSNEDNRLIFRFGPTF